MAVDFFHLSQSDAHAIFAVMPPDLSTRIRRRADSIFAAGLFLFSFWLYLRTLAPSVAEMFDDSLEFQLVGWRLAIPHPTGYPLFAILLKLFAFLPIGDVAFRANLATALFAALTVAFLYLAARKLIRSRIAAAVAALIFAFGDVFWSQAVLAEVYTLQALLTAILVWLVLRTSGEESPGKERESQSSVQANSIPLVAVSFVYGLMLTHHRMSVLLAPALVVYILSYQPAIWRDWRTLLRAAVAFALPLLLYFYIPLRGMSTSSLDGTYQNTPAGFLQWVTASSYTAFLTQNPFNQVRDATYYLDLFIRQFSLVGLALFVLGFVALAVRARREWLFLTLALLANLAFVLSYRVADVNVFFIPSFLFVALFVGIGIDTIARWLDGIHLPQRVRVATAVPLLVFLLLPYLLLQSNFSSVDMSGKWDIHDYGVDILNQQYPPGSTVIGILGEMTLIRYFQDTQGSHPDVQTVAADKEPARLSAIDGALKTGQAVLITRKLAGAEKKYSLSSFGPLILVQPKPNKTQSPTLAHPLDQEFDGIKLIGYSLDLSRFTDQPNWHLSDGRVVRVTLYWRAERKIAEDRSVSLKLLGAGDSLGGQLDRQPVLDAYPTSAWRAGEFISDTYDLPVFVGAAAGEYQLQVTMYNGDSGAVYGQKDLEKVTLKAETNDVYESPQILGVDSVAQASFGGMQLVGYSLQTGDPYVTSDAIPVTLLWRVSNPSSPLDLNLTLIDPAGHVALSQKITVGSENLERGEYSRAQVSLKLPDQLLPATYVLRLGPSTPALPDLPFFSQYLTLGRVQVNPKPAGQ